MMLILIALIAHPGKQGVFWPIHEMVQLPSENWFFRFDLSIGTLPAHSPPLAHPERSEKSDSLTPPPPRSRQNHARPRLCVPSAVVFRSVYTLLPPGYMARHGNRVPVQGGNTAPEKVPTSAFAASLTRDSSTVPDKRNRWALSNEQMADDLALMKVCGVLDVFAWCAFFIVG